MNRDKRGSGHSATTHQPLDVFKPSRDRAVPVRQIVCPDCHAEVGQPCISQAGTPLRGVPHRARRRLALRAGL